MKTYFIGLLLLMLGFTGFLFFKRPGAFQELMSAGKLPTGIETLKQTTNKVRNKILPSSKQYPYFAFVSGDILLNTEAQSYLVQTNIALRKKDQLMVSTNSFGILALGPEKFLRLGEGTKIRFLQRPYRNRGFYEFKLEKGNVFVDVFADNEPIGLKVHLPQNSLSLQDATLRIESTEAGVFLSSIDRGSSQFYIPSTGQVFKVEAGFGAHNQQGDLKVGDFSWVDDYPWDQHIKEVSKTGYGIAATFKATPLSERPKQVIKEDLQVTWSKKKARRVRRRPSKTAGSITGMLKKIGSKAGEGLKGVITAPTKISESKESIQNFEEIQKQRAKQLDAIE